MTKRAVIPTGCWPMRMPPEIAAGYAGKGRRRLWLKTDLDKAIGLGDEPDKDPPVADF